MLNQSFQCHHTSSVRGKKYLTSLLRVYHPKPIGEIWELDPLESALPTTAEFCFTDLLATLQTSQG